MKAKKRRAIASQLIVVDANILRGASSTDGGPPAGARCRSALQDILTICHRAMVSPDLENEYNRHASNYGMRWRAAMARRGKLVNTPAKETGRARGWKQSKHFTKTERVVVDKDLHLVLAAWETKAVVLSGDDRVRALFARLPDLADLRWAQIADDDLDEWLRDGAPADSMALGE